MALRDLQHVPIQVHGYVSEGGKFKSNVATLRLARTTIIFIAFLTSLARNIGDI